MKKFIFLIVAIFAVLSAIYFYKLKPVLLIDNEVTIVGRTTSGARARILELEGKNKTINEIVDTLEEEGYIREMDK